jgi:hypothetical protein
MPDRVTRYRPVSGMQLRAGRYGQSSVMGWPPRSSIAIRFAIPDHPARHWHDTWRNFVSIAYWHSW